MNCTRFVSSSLTLVGLLAAFVPATTTAQAQTSSELAYPLTWGDNFYGQLGVDPINGQTPIDYRSTPGKVVSPAPTLFSNVTTLAAGQLHVVTRKADGTVWTWGCDNYGQLGDGGTNYQSRPVQVKNADGTAFTGITLATAGTNHTLAIKANDGAMLHNTVWAWGSNSNGQLGDGTGMDQGYPVRVLDSTGNALHDIVAIAAGNSHSVALDKNGIVWAWGGNDRGQLGVGSNNASYVAEQVNGLRGDQMGKVTAIAAAGDYTVAISVVPNPGNNNIWAWGDNSRGQIGSNFADPNLYPQYYTSINTPDYAALPDGARAVALSTAPDHALAILSDGTVWAWGDGTYGALGDGSSGVSGIPVQTVLLSHTTAIAAGNGHSLAQTLNGAVYAWGRNDHYQLGLPAINTVTHYVPFVVVPAGSLSQISALSAGSDYSLAYKSDGTVLAWGGNEQGQLASGDTADVPRPTLVYGGIPADYNQVNSLAAGYNHVLALKRNGNVVAWGSNNDGQLGDGTTTSRSYPVQTLDAGRIGLLSNVQAVSAGEVHSIALKNDGTVWTWGDNTNGQLGGSRNRTIQRLSGQVPGLPVIVTISAGRNHSLALDGTGKIWAWGVNTHGELGSGTDNTHITPPTKVKTSANGGDFTGVVAIAGGDQYSVALKNDGTVWAWGSNQKGSIGNNDMMFLDAPYPVQVHGVNDSGFLTDVVSIAAGGGQVVTLNNSGFAYAWGWNDAGQVGNGTQGNNIAFPAAVVDASGQPISNIADIAAGCKHTLFLKNDSTVYACGYDGLGEIGDGMTTFAVPNPQQVLGIGGTGTLDTIFTVTGGGGFFSAALYGIGVMEGSVILQSAQCFPQPITFEFRPKNGGAKFVKTIIGGPQGLFRFTGDDVAPGIYDVAVKGSTWLQKVIKNVNTTGKFVNLNVFLLAGDVDGNNQIDFDDFLTLLNAYGSSTSDSGFDIHADLNCDGTVNFDDFLVLLDNFGLYGDK